jgi:DNA-binding CsgD family transcriptional regulator
VGHREGYRWQKGAWQPSPAQARVLDGVAAGQSNAEIAVRLGLSPETVKSHVARLLAETGCTDRQALAGWWRIQRQGRPVVLPLLVAATRLPRAGLAVAAVGVVLLGIAFGARHGSDAISQPAAHMAPTQPAVHETATATISPRRRMIGTLQQVAGAVLALDIGGTGPARAVVSPDTSIVLVSVERGAAGVKPGDIVRWGRGYRARADGTSIVWDPLPYTTTAPMVLLPESLLGAGRSPTDPERCRWEGVVRGREGNQLQLATFECGEQTITIDPGVFLTRQQPLTAGELPLGATIDVYGETPADGSVAAQTVLVTRQP